MSELNCNRNWNPGQYQVQSPDRIPTYLPLILLPNPRCPHCIHCHLVRRRVGRGDIPTKASGSVGGITQRNGEWHVNVRNNYQRRHRIGHDWRSPYMMGKISKVRGEVGLLWRRQQAQQHIFLQKSGDRQRCSVLVRDSSAVRVNDILLFLIPDRSREGVHLQWWRWR